MVGAGGRLGSTLSRLPRDAERTTFAQVKQKGVVGLNKGHEPKYAFQRAGVRCAARCTARFTARCTACYTARYTARYAARYAARYTVRYTARYRAYGNGLFQLSELLPSSK